MKHSVMSTIPSRRRSDDEEADESSRDLSSTDDDNTSGWDGPNDGQNPMNWSSTRKWMTIALVTAITLIW